jgi:TPR repeat protein
MFAAFIVLVTGALTFGVAGPPASNSDVAGSAPQRTSLSKAELQHLKTRAESGDIEAQLRLAEAYEDGNGVQQSDELAVAWYHRAAEHGNAAAQNNLGLMYSTGRGVEKNKEEAVRWYRKAARQLYSNAMFNLGTAYYNGDGVSIDDASAYAWFLLAQQAGSQPAADAVKRMGSEIRHFQKVEAFARIGSMHEKGEDLGQDYLEAAKWYRRAAEEGDAPSRVRLANILVQHLGRAADYEEARHWCEEAAKQDYSPGAFCVGLLWERGLGVAQDFAQAAKWYSRAADLGHAVALLRLGEMYWKGTGVKLDRVVGYEFVLLASTAELPDAQRMKAQFEKEIDSKDIEKARKRAIEWTKRHPLLGLRKRTPPN